MGLALASLFLGPEIKAVLSNSRVTKLGERLRDGVDDATLLTELEAYRSEFEPAYNRVVRILQEQLFLRVTGRFKSTLSIVEKLRRGSPRLAQIQDIAGCRVVVNSLGEQERVVQSLRAWFSDVKVVRRTIEGNQGYRAVHVLVKIDGRTIEIQIRTLIQNYWASISERMADIHGQEVKYGGGPPAIQTQLLRLARAFESAERSNEAYALASGRLAHAKRQTASSAEWKLLKDTRMRSKSEYQSAMRKVALVLADKTLRGL